MKNNSRVILLLLIVVSFSIIVGCAKEEPITIKGTVMKIDSNKVLISKKVILNLKTLINLLHN